MKKPLILIVLIVAAGAVAWWFTRSRHAGPGTPFQLYGNVDIREVNLGFRVPGRVQEILRDEGDQVANGEVLARLDDTPYRREVEQAQAQAATARARLQLLEAGNRPQEIARARADAREREVALANAQRVYQRQQELFSTNAISIQERDDAEAAYHEADARLKSARELLSLLESGFRAEDIAQGKAEVARAEAALASAELRLEDTVLKAPSRGVVLTRAQEPGAILQTGATVLTVCLTRPVWVRAYIPEPDLGRLHPGGRVEVRTDTHPDRPYAGTIGYISPRAEFTPKNVETAELRTSLVYRFRVVVENPDDGLRQGMPVTVRLLEK